METNTSKLPRIGATLNSEDIFRRLKARLTLRGESITKWINRLAELEVKGKLPTPTSK